MHWLVIVSILKPFELLGASNWFRNELNKAHFNLLVPICKLYVNSHYTRSLRYIVWPLNKSKHFVNIYLPSLKVIFSWIKWNWLKYQKWFYQTNFKKSNQTKQHYLKWSVLMDTCHYLYLTEWSKCTYAVLCRSIPVHMLCVFERLITSCVRFKQSRNSRSGNSLLWAR